MDKFFEFGKAICYSGYREGQSPKTVAPFEDEIREDLHILVDAGFKYVRMYDPNVHAERVLKVIREEKLPLKAMIGIDSDHEINNAACPFEKQELSEAELQANRDRNDAEIDKLIALVKKYPDEVMAVSVGNENTPVWTAHKVPEERLIEHARKLKANLDVPVTFNEGCDDWPNIMSLAKEVDFISGHSYPYHVNINEVDKAIAYNTEHLKRMRETFPDKPFLFSEMGWSSCISVDAEKEYDEALFKWLEENQVIGFVFEAFDELWKSGNPKGSESCFGIYGENRKKKW